MALLTVQPRDGELTFDACDSGGDTFSNDGKTEVFLDNRGGGDRTVTFVAARRCSHGFLDDLVVIVTGGTLFPVGPFAANRFNDADGIASITYDAATDLHIGVKRQT